MGMLKLTFMAGVALALAACGGEQKTEAPPKAPAKLAAGLYELNAEVVQLASTDQSTPATKFKQGDKQVIRACVAADGKPAPELLAEGRRRLRDQEQLYPQRPDERADELQARGPERAR